VPIFGTIRVLRTPCPGFDEPWSHHDRFDIHHFAEHFVCFGIPKQQMTIIWAWKLTNLSKIPLTVVLLLLVGRVLVTPKMFEQKSYFALQMFEQKSCFIPIMVEKISCFALQMFEQMSCFAPQTFAQKSCFTPIVNVSLPSSGKSCIN